MSIRFLLCTMVLALTVTPFLACSNTAEEEPDEAMMAADPMTGEVEENGMPVLGDGAGAARSFQLVYEARIPAADLADTTEPVTLVVPIPNANAYQEVEATVTSNGQVERLTDSLYGNDIALATPTDASQDLWVRVEVAAVRHAVMDEAAWADAGSEVLRERFLEADNLVPIDGVIADRAVHATDGATTELAQLRGLYDDVLATFVYDKSGTGWGRGDAMWACDAERGNCTDFHSVLIGMARSLGIPARFRMGLSIPQEHGEGDVGGYHCWAEFYVDGHGWMPMDASEASKDPAKMEWFFGGLCENRLAFSLGRDIPLTINGHDVKLNYLINPVVYVGDQTADIAVRSVTYHDAE